MPVKSMTHKWPQWCWNSELTCVFNDSVRTLPHIVCEDCKLPSSSLEIEDTSWMRGEMSSRNWNKYSCQRYSTWNYCDLDDWEPSSTLYSHVSYSTIHILSLSTFSPTLSVKNPPNCSSFNESTKICHSLQPKWLFRLVVFVCFPCFLWQTH